MDDWEFWGSEARGGAWPPPSFAPGSIIQHGRRIPAWLWPAAPSNYDYQYSDDEDAEEPTAPLVVLPPLQPGSSGTQQGHAAAAVPPSNKRGRAAASSKAIEGLREVTAAAAAMDGSDDCCAICLQEFDSRPDAEAPAAPGLRAMPCSHTFHQRCIGEWLRRNPVCPLCRYELPTEEDDEEDQLEQGRPRGMRQIVYDEEDGRYYLVSRLTEDPTITDEEEQELARLNAQAQPRTTP
ncbi:hypothetical protein HU200_003311 [Digitaria exilis]|uniref:RING-type domain-containing protein n=1 Tax=Digitaria exilis TaxID=1010633 RepID=A0A835KYE7_9POAL|nr:hypothetical protein HU200_003311 [Digitaria exilis]